MLLGQPKSHAHAHAGYPSKAPPMSLKSACCFLVASLLLAGCASEENLLDSFTAKRQEAAEVETTGSPESSSDPANESAGDAPTATGTEEANTATEQTVTKPVMVSDQQLRDAALAGNGPAVAAAVESGVDVNSPDENGRTALMLAAYDGHTEIVKLLLKHKAQVNRRDSMDRTALIYCASGKNPESVQAL